MASGWASNSGAFGFARRIIDFIQLESSTSSHECDRSRAMG